MLLCTAKGLAAPVRTVCGFSQGCTLDATAYGTLVCCARAVCVTMQGGAWDRGCGCTSP